MDIEFLLAAYWKSLLAFALFGLGHSVCAQEPFKDRLAEYTSPFFVDHFWRIIYNLLSFGGLYYIVSNLHWLNNPDNDRWLLDYPDWLWQGILVAHAGSIVVTYVAFIQSDFLEFLGFRQAWRGLAALLGRGRNIDPQLFGTQRLVVNGIYGWLRHPMLSGGLLFLLTSAPTLNNFSYTFMYAAYMFIGGHYEERRLIKIFGTRYRAYQRRVGAYFPRLWRLRLLRHA